MYLCVMGIDIALSYDSKLIIKFVHATILYNYSLLMRSMHGFIINILLTGRYIHVLTDIKRL